ncbi:MAG: UDP-N-acetylglucosamine-peptide N-acetylglucosaminyltransferase, partial [Selenomonadales bacterium]|nr:UDP-N-acetylglucosamine-peptide N-acetylglucosaminyltransferase [Selenomonadales bacterium]
LENMGLGELATDNPDRYVDIAIALANDEDVLSYLHKNIRKMLQKSPVMNTKLYMKQIQEQYTHYLQESKENRK